MLKNFPTLASMLFFSSSHNFAVAQSSFTENIKPARLQLDLTFQLAALIASDKIVASCPHNALFFSHSGEVGKLAYSSALASVVAGRTMSLTFQKKEDGRCHVLIMEIIN